MERRQVCSYSLALHSRSDLILANLSTDPQNVQIYLATYDDSNVNYLQGPETATSEGNEEITFSEGPPPGQSWTWQFYDASRPVETGVNQIAESDHFTFAASVLPSPKKKGLSAGAAAGIAIVIILLFAAAGAAAFWWFYYRPRAQRRRKAHGEVLFQPPQAEIYAGKHELGSDGLNPSSTLTSPDHGPTHPFHQPQPYPLSPVSPNLSPQYELENPHRVQAYHEMAGQGQQWQQQGPPPEPHSAELSSTNLSPANMAVERSRSETRRKPIATNTLDAGKSPSTPSGQVYEM